MTAGAPRADRRPHSWQACPRCGATVLVWRDASLILPVGALVEAKYLRHPDGSPCLPFEGVACPNCGLQNGCMVDTPCRRWGLALPADCRASELDR